MVFFFFFPNSVKEKLKKCTWIASSLVWERFDLENASLSSLFSTKRNALIVFLHCSSNNSCLNILEIKSTNRAIFWMAPVNN